MITMNAQGDIVDQARSAGADISDGPGFVQAMYLMDRAWSAAPQRWAIRTSGRR
ncbi:hypothetical protein [Streptomyces rhizosphaericus]|uniref:Uncharacterized protein n=1 Tax=Streptomyces rhizosphaericus TaxID=114699 RepID=A0A6G4A763_9ACTN|nr:hypothetical protein [Streptomyces rhizosphaericus]NEW69236.1 hypothetical protein [Streptomyces rhizosphaericus]